MVVNDIPLAGNGNLTLHGPHAPELVQLAMDIADYSARFDIDYACTVVMMNDGEWIDTAEPAPDVASMPADDREILLMQVLRAMRYLDLRGHLEHHPLFPKLIRFSELKAPH